MTGKRESKTIYHNTYWNHQGKHPKLQELLEKLIPVSGEVSNADDNPYLETYRNASNCYYDLYNNGLCNRAEEFERVFGFAPDPELTAETVRETELKINKIILAAAKEQKLEVAK